MSAGKVTRFLTSRFSEKKTVASRFRILAKSAKLATLQLVPLSVSLKAWRDITRRLTGRDACLLATPA